MRAIKNGVLLSTVMLALGGICEAQVHRTFVGVLGNDGNDCLTAATACRTINGATNKVDAEGEVIVVSTGSYAGATITKSVRINAPSGIVAFAALPITINAPGATVAIRGFTIKAITPGTGTGIVVTDVGTLLLESMTVDGWSTGLQVNAAGSKVSIADSVFRNNNGTTGGIAFNAALNASVVRSRFEKNIRGIQVSGGGTVSVARSSFTGNTSFGLIVGAAGGVAAVDRCLIADGGTGLRTNAGATIRLSNSSVSGLTVGVEVNGGLVESFGTSGIRGNTTNISGALTPVPLQ